MRAIDDLIKDLRSLDSAIADEAVMRLIQLDSARAQSERVASARLARISSLLSDLTDARIMLQHERQRNE